MEFAKRINGVPTLHYESVGRDDRNDGRAQLQARLAHAEWTIENLYNQIKELTVRSHSRKWLIRSLADKLADYPRDLLRRASHLHWRRRTVIIRNPLQSCHGAVIRSPGRR